MVLRLKLVVVVVVQVQVVQVVVRSGGVVQMVNQTSQAGRMVRAEIVAAIVRRCVARRTRLLVMMMALVIVMVEVVVAAIAIAIGVVGAIAAVTATSAARLQSAASFVLHQRVAMTVQ